MSWLSFIEEVMIHEDLEAQNELDAKRQAKLEADKRRCPVCGDPTGVRCCEFGADRA